MSVSEPVKGYVPYEKDGKGVQATYIATTGQYNETLDIPVDAQRDTILGGPETGIWAILNANATVPAYRIIYLQRLADPTRPWAPEAGNPAIWNPYRTVDAMTVDLTTFNGMPLVPPATAAKDPTTTTGTYHFESHQRGEKNSFPVTTAPGQPLEVNLWKQEPANKNQAGWTGGARNPTAKQVFNLPLNQTLGFLNQPFGTPAASGDPQFPFPWLNFSYRPFNNEYELLLVPTVSQSRLLARNTVDPRRYFAYVDSAVRSANPQSVYNRAGRRPGQRPGPLSASLEFLRVGKIESGGPDLAIAPLVRLCGRAVEVYQRAASNAPIWPHRPGAWRTSSTRLSIGFRATASRATSISIR